jgi:hypothetical protein
MSKCACCCPLPEGECCLLDRFTQAVLEISGVGGGGFCDCANQVYVFDLSDASSKSEVIPCDFAGFPIQVVRTVNAPIACEETVITENGLPAVVPDVWSFRVGNVSFVMQIAFKQQNPVFPQPGQFPNTFLSIELDTLGSTLFARSLCSDFRRPVQTCAEAVSQLPSFRAAA